MTIRLRNRMTLFLFFISIIFFLFTMATTLYQVFKGNFSFVEINTENTILNNSWLSYNPKCTLIAIFILQAYVFVTSITIYRSFGKTQSSDISFFIIFLLSCLLNSTRILFPLLHISTNYSFLLLVLGNVNMFARLLAPLSLFGVTVLSNEQYRQYNDRNCIIIIVTALFFTQLIPINNAIVLPNFCISYGYVHLVRTISFIMCILDLFTLIITNKKNEFNQITSIGFLFVAIAYSIMFYCYNLFGLICGPIFLAVGTTLYLNELHRHYLWIN